MKLVVAFVHTSHAAPVLHVLEQAGLFHLSVGHVRVVAQPDAPIVRPQLAPEGEPEVRFEAYCTDEQVERVVGLIRTNAHIGSLPSGAVFVHPIEHGSAISAFGMQ